MRKLYIFVFAVLFFNLSFSQGYIKSYLENKLLETDAQLIPVIIKLKSQVNLVQLKQDLLKRGLNREERRIEIVKALYNSNSNQNSFDVFINELKIDNPLEIDGIKKFWAVNVVACKVSSNLIVQLVNNVEVEYVQFDFPVSSEKVTESLNLVNKNVNSVGGAELGLIAVNARPMWALGYTGRNRLAMNIDSGVNVDHPTLKDRFLGHFLPLSQAWFGYENPYPYDADQSHFHGTHTMGTMIGLDSANADTIGLAMNAFWIASDPIVSDIADVRPLSDYFMAFEWALNPDGDITTSNDIPDVINNSWGVSYAYWANTWSADCDPMEYDFIEALEAADCSIIFSNGNDGPDPTTTGMPAGLVIDTLNIFAVGALDGNNTNWPIASFSSRGPSNCDIVNSVGMKPEVSAPGVDVRSAGGGAEYRVLSGTSMAGPHVAGAVLLLREAFPDITSTALKNALYQTAIDLGDIGEDNTYGRGMIDVFAAYEYLSQTYTPTPPVTNQYDIAIDTIIGRSTFVCEESNYYEVRIKNKGEDVLSNFIFRLVLDSDTIIEMPINITLQANETYDIPIDIILLDTTSNILFEIEKNGIAESNIYNNYRSIALTRLFPNEIPFYEGFETLNADLLNSNFAIVNSDNLYTWGIGSAEGIENSQKSLRMPFAYYEPRNGQLDYFVTGSFEIPSEGNTFLFFKHAYAQSFSSRKDSLFILISTSCDIETGDTVFNKGGADLKTKSSSVFSYFVPNDSTEWANDTIDLTDYAGEIVFIKFIAKNDRSNNLYIDELTIENSLGIDELLKSELSFYPNPTTGEIIFDDKLNGEDIFILDISGKKLMQTKVRNNKISVASLNNGLYFMKSSSGLLSKFIIQK